MIDNIRLSYIASWGTAGMVGRFGSRLRKGVVVWRIEPHPMMFKSRGPQEALACVLRRWGGIVKGWQGAVRISLTKGQDTPHYRKKNIFLYLLVPK